MLISNQINLCVDTSSQGEFALVTLLKVNNRMDTGAIECIHCSPGTPPFFAVNKHWQNNRLTDKPHVSASII